MHQAQKYISSQMLRAFGLSSDYRFGRSRCMVGCRMPQDAVVDRLRYRCTTARARCIAMPVPIRCVHSCRGYARHERAACKHSSQGLARAPQHGFRCRLNESAKEYCTKFLQPTPCEVSNLTSALECVCVFGSTGQSHA